MTVWPWRDPTTTDFGSSSRDRACSGGADAGQIAPGTLIGRYIVVGEIGRGGMGTVLSAWDPSLGRRVALKLLRHVREHGDTQLLEEARALASIRDRNVVTVYDVGRFANGVFVAMEFVESPTLRVWSQQEQSAADRVSVLHQAARGLLAAHRAGVVHGDFKPSNVLVERTGEGLIARVIDFGLAQRAVPARGHDRDGDEAMAPIRAGTPAYAAPEQRKGRIDARSDQFSWCVTAWEVLFGGPPFGSATASGFLVPSSSHGRRLSWVLQRGLQVDPEARWPSIEHLLGEIECVRARHRRMRSTLVVTAAGTIAAATCGAWWLDRERRIADCESTGSAISEMWNDAARQRVHESLVATGRSHAEVTAEKTIPWLDRHARAWQDTRTELCLAADIRGAVDGDALDRSLWCLDERRRDLQALLHELENASPQMVQASVIEAARLPDVERCLDYDVLSAAPSAALRPHVHVVRRGLARARSLYYGGRFAESVMVADAAIERARQLGWAPMLARAWLQRGSSLTRLGQHAAAEDALIEAFFIAARVRAIDEALTACARLTFVVGVRQHRAAEGLLWAQHAELWLGELGGSSGLERAGVLGNLASVYQAKRDLPMAVELLAQAVAEQERVLGPDHPTTASGLANLAIAHDELGEHEIAGALFERSLQTLEEALGPDHPDVAAVRYNLARFHASKRQDAVAREHAIRALRSAERAYGPDDRAVAGYLDLVGSIHYALGEYADAEAAFARGLEIVERAQGPEDVEFATLLINQATLYAHHGDLERAKLGLQRALAIAERELGEDDLLVSAILDNLARAHQAAGELDEADGFRRRAMAIRQAEASTEHSDEL